MQNAVTMQKAVTVSPNVEVVNLYKKIAALRAPSPRHLIFADGE
jgi:hypothetical protein